MRYFIITLLLSIPTYIFAQVTISGTVRDADGEPLPGAMAYLADSYDGATTDADGNFSFVTSRSGEQVLTVDYLGFKSHRQPISLPADLPVFKIQLQAEFNELEAVAITAGAFTAGDRHKAVTLNSIDMVTTPGAAGDVYGALQTLPGTTPVGESGRLYVRGGTSRETQTFIDGQLVQVPFNSAAPGVPTRGRFSPFMFQGTLFSTGGYSAEYGQALSSVLLLDTKNEDLEDRFDLGILSVGGNVAGTKVWKGGSVTADLGVTHLGPYISVVPQNLNWESAPKAAQGSLSLRQATSKTGMFRLYTMFSRTHSTLEVDDPNADDRTARYDLENDNLYVNASWEELIAEKWQVRTGVSGTVNPDRIGLDGADVERTLRGWHAKTVVVHAPIEKVKLRMGAEMFGREFAQEYRNEVVAAQEKYQDQQAAAFVEAEVYATQDLGLRAGLRTLHSGMLGQTVLSPRLSLAYRMAPNTTLSLAGGRFEQMPEDDVLLYTDDLRMERADQILVNVFHQKNKRTIRAEAFYKNYNHLTRFENGDFGQPVNIDNGGEGYAYGFDLIVRDRKTIRNGDYWLSYSFLEAERQHRDFPEMVQPTFASRHNLNFVYKHWIGKWRSLVGGRFSYASPRPYDNPNAAAFMSARMPAYKSLDLNWSYLYRQNIIFYSSVTNVPGFRQQFGYRFADAPDASGQYAATEILPPARRFFVLGCFITLSKKGNNQLDQIN